MDGWNYSSGPSSWHFTAPKGPQWLDLWRSARGKLNRQVCQSDRWFYDIKPIPLDSLILVAFGDSAFANAPGGKSQGGFLITATTEEAARRETDASLLDWKSYRHQRVLRSTLASEAASLDKSEDYANFLGCMLGELTCPEYIASHSGKSPFAIWPVTDARSLFDAIHRLATSFAEKRVEIDIAALRQTCRNLRWVPTEAMLADGLTKRSRPLRDRLRNWQKDPKVSLTDSQQAEDTSNHSEPWRSKPKENKTSEIVQHHVTFNLWFIGIWSPFMLVGWDVATHSMSTWKGCACDRVLTIQGSRLHYCRGYIDGKCYIMLPYIAAPWIRHGIGMGNPWSTRRVSSENQTDGTMGRHLGSWTIKTKARSSTWRDIFNVLVKKLREIPFLWWKKSPIFENPQEFFLVPHSW